MGGRGASSSVSSRTAGRNVSLNIPGNVSRQQRFRIESLYNNVLRELYGSTRDDYEIKEFDVSVREINKNTSSVSVSIETGLKGDEGTLASALARNRALIFIGKNGGMRHAQWGNTKNKTTKFLYQAFYDYRSK